MTKKRNCYDFVHENTLLNKNWQEIPDKEKIHRKKYQEETKSRCIQEIPQIFHQIHN